jgi:5-methylcytosine-specific restriction protein A
VSHRVCYCGKLTKNKTRCDACETKWVAKNPRRATTAPREGKSPYDQDWKDLRLEYLADHPLCEDCEERGYVEAAEEVHHMVPISVDPDLRLDWDNLRALCIPDHRAADARIVRQRRLHDQTRS